MLKRTWLFVLPMVAALLYVGAAPSQAAGEKWIVTGVNSTGCAASAWSFDVNFSGFDGTSGGYIAHTTVTAGGLVYMNEQVTDPGQGDETWHLYSSSSYGPITGTYPIPSGTQMKAVFTLEKPKGTVLSSWTVIARKCDSGTLLYNAADLDQDTVADASDGCPSLAAATADGCPLRDRSLTLKARHGHKRVVGQLFAAGYPALYADRTVTIWQVRPGPDRKVATRTTDGLGAFKARVKKGRYYATSPGFIAPTSGEAAADTSGRVRVR
jgi:hypothetical protein